MFKRLISAAVLLPAALWGGGASAAPVTLTVASFPSFDEAVKVAIPEFKKKHPDVEIKLVSLAYPDHHTAMTTALATGANLPDVMAVEIGFIGKFAESGGLEDLGVAPYSGLQYQKQFARFTYPQAMSGLGKLAAMPADIGPGALFYRKACSSESIVQKMSQTQVNLKLIPHVDGTPAIAQLVAYELADIQVHGAWSGPTRLHLVPHVNAPVADLPVRGVVGGLHFIADLALPYGRVIHDYLAS